ncbi:bifunctional phosphoribosylaminoimidazolecarboxamide formyltransferase/IMP cyclohydrolase [Clostridium butyricum]|jgi:phosphoribosylaminoimidazolecarboxamide formyltransferase/IMP cyclohydrolase|uniref:bifunctional phosphoribosylaminoimidazolecarboxamide formyltransferase/IMP cyclohydrolase n=1 Tax=Clostridium butyricum TaxID=1492 RepID=UPI0029000AB4|nr:bifunctional phosphoribosylaminoimidazolecarboxamide formyltransferase/IMP cyclohydrolase [Clostridium butyricum]MDU1003631.1 bifunctional phosphoribosylaminoimidazolecarboxamide formyltransferase/IMP cyclohydrolase [Clostridium butyricum]MDU4801520.1 bifunctional phosphoribosylaminoimidazolecarboxamide formyltransferase/IMP cyclohydrolase [Clostridium butyricum]MDU6038142.1 bifunctional phosphoribosylaminoimidazolecarboxamide formyltransferase/IMP cyclohydrolase [Clostridium butyricum]
MKKRALISVFDKDGVLDFAKFLVSKDVEIVSTGGTYRYLKENGIDVIEINEVTNFPEMLDGRVKTLHPLVHAGILAIRDDEEHMNTLKERNIHTIDYVVVNLYPFFEKVKEDLTFEEKVEFIDIGGPTMLRAAAKNFQDVVVISNKNDYAKVMDEINEHNEVSYKFKKKLAGKVFNLMSAYDAAISNFMLADDEEEYPEYLSVSYKRMQSLRYGENSHQSAAVYSSTMLDGAMNTFETLNGKELSYNNFKDVDIAWKCANEFDEPACCALKHNTPCGVAVGNDSYEAYMKAYEVDPTSIFGGIIGFNRKVDKKTAEEMVKIFLEVVAAPDYDDDALEVLKSKKNLRVLKFNNVPKAEKYMVTVDGAMLVQEEDRKLVDEIKVVTEKVPTDEEMKDLLFGMKVVKYVKSNAIVTAHNGVAVGIGGGQVNRIWPTEDALKRGKGATILASDAFFPFRDVVDEAAKYGIKAIVQPGGSMRDQESIDACNEHGIAMIFTGYRHFKH